MSDTKILVVGPTHANFAGMDLGDVEIVVVDSLSETTERKVLDPMEYCKDFGTSTFTRPWREYATEQAIRDKSQPKRNDPCNCGSGKKFKKCCLLTPKENTRDE